MPRPLARLLLALALAGGCALTHAVALAAGPAAGLPLAVAVVGAAALALKE